MNVIAGRIGDRDTKRLTLPGGSQRRSPGRRSLGRENRSSSVSAPRASSSTSTMDCLAKSRWWSRWVRETHLIARSGDTEIVVVLRERLGVREGDTVNLSLTSAQAHFFDPETGDRLPFS